jgi:two-component system LytT family response regulator
MASRPRTLLPPYRMAVVLHDVRWRRQFTEWLGTLPGWVQAGLAATGPTAVDLLRVGRPDAVLLAADLPGTDGFEILLALPPAERPVVLFCSPDPDAAARAFEFDAADFLILPVTVARWQAAMERVTRRLQVVRTGPPDASASERLSVRAGRRVLVLVLEQILSLRSQDVQTEIHRVGQQDRVGESLQSLCQRLPSDRFLRVHRSAVVNLDHVREVRPKAHGDGVAILADGSEVPVSRTRRRALLQALSRHQGPVAPRKGVSG